MSNDYQDIMGSPVVILDYTFLQRVYFDLSNLNLSVYGMSRTSRDSVETEVWKEFHLFLI